jgi:hypothetical protein
MTAARPAVAVVVARTEFRRTLRNLDTSAGAALMVLSFGFLGLLGTFGGGVAAFFFGRDLAAGSVPAATARTVVRSGATGVVAGVTFLSAMRTVGEIGRLDQPAGVLTATTHPPVAVGVALAELARWLALLGLPLVAVAAGLALGAGSVAVGLLALTVALLCLVVGLLVGYVVGLAAKNVAARSRTVARYRGAFTFLWAVGLPMAWVLLSTTERFAEGAGALLGTIPTGLLGELLLLATPIGSPQPALVVAGTAVTVLAVPLLLAAGVRLAGALWYVDRVEPPGQAVGTDASGGLATGRLTTLTTPATAAVAHKSWRRGRRAPFSLQWAWTPIFGLIYPLQSVLLGDGGFPLVGPFVGLALATAAGAAFTLNPVGGEGAVLPTVLTSRVSGRSFVAGLALAGALPGLALSLVGVAGVGLLAGLPPTGLAWALVYAVLVTVAAPFVASGIGTAFPKFETREVGGIGTSREAIVPSGWAFAYYAVALAVAGLPGLLGQSALVSEALGSWLGVAPVAVTAVSVALTAGLAGLAGAVSFRRAAGVVQTYRF